MSTSEQDLTERSRAIGRRRKLVRRSILVLLAILIAAGAWWLWVETQVKYYAAHDQAAASDAIVVFGAAEYAGKPSPVYRARLEHARNLYEHGIAPLIITLGGPGGDGFTEGGVGREYLMGTGIPEADLIAETHSRSTSESARRLAIIARANNLRRLVIVSDAMHLFRIHAICAADGLNVLTSPRPPSASTEEHVPASDPMWHEIVTYTLWRLKLD